MAQSKEQIFRKLESIRDLPTLPVILEKLKKEMLNPDCDATRIARIVEDDPSMMARILKVVNSPLYSGAERIDTLPLAISRMGLNAISNIALSTSVFSTFGPAWQKDFDRKEFWRHSISTGIAANVIYERRMNHLTGRYEKNEIHLAGLLHDIGKIVFEQYFHDEFVSSVLFCKQRSIPLFQMELECIGADHAQVGAWLGERWRLSEKIIETIRWHHEPTNAKEEYQELIMMCHAANYICNLVHIGDSGDAVAPAFFRGVWKRLGVDIEEISGMIEQIKEESKKSELMLSLLS
jgi:putative nucleotidyltransferase with HDIG domain